MKNYLAQITVGPIKGPGTGTLSNAGANSGNVFADFISSAIGVMTIIAAIMFLFKIITGGIAIINSDGDKQAISTARGSITNGVIGLVVIISATFIVGIVGFLLGVDNFLDVAGWIDDLGI